jgi:general secretion pathway protein J
MRRASSQAGFTLIEMLIGITLLAMLGALIASGTRLGSRSWSSAERRSAGSDDVMLVQSFFRRTIAQTAPAFASEDPRDMTIDFSGGPDTLTLMAPQPGTQSAGLWVQERFYVAQHGAHRDLLVRLRFDPSLPGTAPDPVTLLEGVSQVRFAYFGAAAPGAAPTWQDNWINSSRLPDLIRIEIVRDDPKLPAWPALSVGTRVTSNAGCIYTGYGTGCRRTR